MGEKILAKALLLVPVRTGALKSTGRVVKSQNRKNYEVRFGNGRIQYALVVEFGPHSIRALRTPTLHSSSRALRLTTFQERGTPCLG